MSWAKKALEMQSIAGWLKQNKLGIILLPWLAAAVSVLLMKKSLLLHPPSPLYVQIALGLRTPPMLHFWEKVALFRSDLLCYFFLVPLLFCLLTIRLSVRWQMLIVILSAFFVEAVVYAEAIVFLITGAFSSLTMMWVSVAWALKSHSALFSLPAETLYKIAAMIVFVGLFTLIALVALHKNARWLNHASLAVFGLGSAIAAIAWIPSVPAMPWTQTLLQMTAYPAFLDNNLFLLHSGSVPNLLEAYRESSHVPAREPSAFSGKAKNYNVLLIVMEALTAQAFDPARDSLSDMPNVRRLREQSFLMGRHYTSYPLTNAAAFSIFTSLYEKSATGKLIGNRIELPGLIHNLRDAGYETGYYGYIWKSPSERDDRMLASFGFDKIVEPKIDPVLDSDGLTTFYGPVEYADGHDRQVLLSLREQIRDWTARRQRFAAAFFPEIGHDPYRELSGHTSKSEIERGHALAVYQDAWLGELLDELQRDGALDNTIIVLTADHGMRFLTVQDSTRVSFLSHGKVKDVTMRVPMLIYVPGVLKYSILINYPTSHIDIAPTLLDLLGISAGRELEQGSSIMSRGIEKRRLFLSMDFFGASGFYYNGNYYSCSPGGVVYKNSVLNFGDNNILRYDSKEAEDTRAVLAEQDVRQKVLLDHVLEGEYR
jgi:phosphoglycerol transferase MdoB-like AlkP superfamily enzyme